MRHARRTIFRLFFVMACMWFGAAQAATPEESFNFFRAVQMDDARTVQALLGKGLDPNAKNPVGGEPALVAAVREGSMQVLEVLLANPSTNIEVNALNGNTALMMAAFKHNKPALMALLNKGAAVDRQGWTALHYAAAAGDDEIARILLQRGARIDAVSPPASGLYTPLMLAAREGRHSTAQLLIEQGANPRLKNSEDLTAAQIAERAGQAALSSAIEAQAKGR
ncbi:ankyrin repeat domain-containing protein [Massilia horti]|uniref:Ankyrin repeat domain-containing protein n=1 Tax=Massilia horti TaxID=2562153 RepID=A0A4Y9SQN9_9BURK|nr:ankyrin repeat domain-containing protein [Massilia horti]TFW28970.1 ankyrin repeat domain-containing protein [Massilia horti]